MIKPEQLRIGNYIIIENPKYHPKISGNIMEITGIKENVYDGKIEHLIYIKELNKKYSSPFSQFIEYIKPIPITEEWLIKLGFKEEGKIFKIKINDEQYIRLSTGHNGASLTLDEHSCPFSDERTDCISLPTYEYIHQLQNIYYWLTGGHELKIK